MRIAFASVGLVLALAACKRSEPAPLATLSASAAASAPPPAPTMPVAGAPGYAYIVAKKLVAIAPDGKLTTVEGKRGEPKTVVRSSDGKAYALFVDSLALDVVRLEGVTATVVASLEECDPRRGAFDARGDHFVVKCLEHLYEKNGGDFAKMPPLEFGFDEGVWISPRGTVWYGSDKRVAEYDKGAWRKAEIPGHDMIGPPEAWFDTAKGVVFANSDRVYRVDGEKVVELVKQPHVPTFVRAASNGLFGWIDEKGVSLHTLEGQVKRFDTKTPLARGAVLDDAGRVWSLEDGQLAVVDANGTTTVPMGSYPELDHLGVLAEITVLGAGAMAPPAKPVRRTKKITGTITLDGKPAANAAIEICPRRGWVYHGGTPCTGADPAIVLTTTADAKGAFTVQNAPMGSYYVHYKLPDAERWSIDSSELKLVENGDSNLGKLEYKSRP